VHHSLRLHGVIDVEEPHDVRGAAAAANAQLQNLALASLRNQSIVQGADGQVPLHRIPALVFDQQLLTDGLGAEELPSRNSGSISRTTTGKYDIREAQ
jgi:hypothetical protein